MLLLAVLTSSLTFKIQITTLETTTCFDPCGHPQPIQPSQKGRTDRVALVFTA